MLCQQKGSKLRGAVSVEKVRGECAYFEQIGSVEAVKAGARSGSGYTYHTETPITDMPYSRRRVDMGTWRLADPLWVQPKQVTMVQQKLILIPT